jgi:hypothetical protein
VARHVDLTATPDAAIWGAQLALGEGRGRICIVEPTGPVMDDRNLHSPEAIRTMQDHLERLRQHGIAAIDD